VGSDVPVIQARVRAALGLIIQADVAQRMILIMRADLNVGVRLRYDEPALLCELHERAVRLCGEETERPGYATGMA
jgi:hypothetical protein